MIKYQYWGSFRRVLNLQRYVGQNVVVGRLKLNNAVDSRTPLITKVFIRSIHYSIPPRKGPPISMKDIDYKIDDLHLDKISMPTEKVPITLHHEVYGKNTNQSPIIFLHGFLNDGRIYSSVAPQINTRTGKPCYTYDLRNHGQSGRKFPHDYQSMVEDVIYTIEKQGLKDVSLIGHSMGAKVAMLVSLKRPDLISDLIVIDNSPVVNDVSKLDRMIERLLIGLCHVETQLTAKYGKDIVDYKLLYDDTVKILRQFNINDLVIKAILPNIVVGKPHKLTASVLPFMKYDVRSKLGDWPVSYLQPLKKLDKPTLVIRAKRSRYINDDNLTNDYPKYFNDLTVTEMNTGHFAFVEHPTQFVKIVSEFLNRPKAS
ncbi:putative ethanol acetyltransferase 1 [[Candida] jaroonii]|uniref:Ethanol acetyltransferase 1 n=1 Tax=[Candida] jaroonii TaxID=467808 RepID=A0ACA9YBF2_9ASCO|nr:putative ethanol acetyltransferase 1 [[Candida] jaroonii]